MKMYQKGTPAFQDVFAAITNERTTSVLDFDNINEAESENIILGPKMGVLDSETLRHKKVANRFQEFKANDWTWWEFEFNRCIKEWHTVPKDHYEKMIKTIAWQWEGDAAAAIGMMSAVGSFITDSTCYEYEARIIDNEITHSKTYANMTNQAFADPTHVKREILSSENIRARLMPVARALHLCGRAGMEYQLGLRENDQDTYNYGLLYEVVMLILEKIQFNPSFLMTHLLTSDGAFAPISLAVQKIAVDELNFHVPHRMYTIANELTTERGKAAWRSMKPMVNMFFDLVLNSELDWLKKDVFADGKELPGGSLDIACKYALHCGYDVAELLSLDCPYDLPSKNPVHSMAKWLNIDGSQRSPQDQTTNNYSLVSVVDNDDDGSGRDLMSLLDEEDDDD